MNLINSLFLLASLYCLWLFLTFLLMSDDDYNRHRELLLHPENDILGDTITNLIMTNDGKLICRKRVSIGATKRLLTKVWNE